MKSRTEIRKYRRYHCRVETASDGHPLIWYLLVVLLLAGSAAMAFAWLQSERAGMGRELQRLRREFAVTAKEVENLKMEVESYRGGTYILSAVDTLGLKLRHPLPGQVVRVSGDRIDETQPGWSRAAMVAGKETPGSPLGF